MRMVGNGWADRTRERCHERDSELGLESGWFSPMIERNYSVNHTTFMLVCECVCNTKLSLNLDTDDDIDN